MYKLITHIYNNMCVFLQKIFNHIGIHVSLSWAHDTTIANCGDFSGSEEGTLSQHPRAISRIRINQK